MDGEDLEQGFEQLNLLAKSEYHADLTQLLRESDAARSAIRVGRLVGVLLKEPFATRTDSTSPSTGTAAYTSWSLKNEEDFNIQQETWQYKTLERIRTDLSLNGMTVYQLAEYAQNEKGFFGYVAQVLCKYICGDKALRRKIADKLKAANASGYKLPQVTPETIIGAGGLSLGAILVQHIPLLGMVGAPVIAAIVVIIYTLGITAFCTWTKNLRTGDFESN